jgi:hypothetical protein
MAINLQINSRDWLGSVRSRVLAWQIPKLAIVGGLLAPVTVRTGIWIIALAWMGTACILNARRCGRTHCRYTGPYYLVMIVPVALLGFGTVADIYAWVLLACVILVGGKLIWWATERAWGKFS